jgi:integrase
VPGEKREKCKAGYVDRAATEQLAARLEREHARRHEGIEAPAAGPLGPLVERWGRDLAAGDRTAAHVKLYVRRVAQAAAACRWSAVADLGRGAAGEAQRWLAGRLTLPTRRDGRISAQTLNHWRTALVAFGSWLVDQDLLPANPFPRIERRQVEPARVLVRRALTSAQLARLLDATAASAEERYGLDGPARSALYLAAAVTGFRARALASMTAAAFDLAADPPTASIDAKASKKGKAHQVILPAWAADRLRPWLHARKPGPLWPGNWAAHTAAAKMLRPDLLAAEILPWNTRGESFDFHALRGQYATMLVDAGVNPKAAQELLDHSDIRLTLQRYAKTDAARLAAEVAKVPAPKAA